MIEPIERPKSEAWRIPTRIAFRFAVVYLGLFSLTHAIFVSLIPIPGLQLPDLATAQPFRSVTLWVAAHLFHFQAPPSFEDTGSGDKAYDWVQIFTLVCLAAIATLVWSVLDRKRTSYRTLDTWFRLIIRFGLARQLIGYAVVKVFPLQMPPPRLSRLVERLGDFSPMGVLWSSIGASPGYERFIGCTEMLAAVLLMVPATSTLGAMVALGVMTEVFVLNLTYDIPVKIFSGHLVLLGVFLLVPSLTRLADIFVLGRPATLPRPDLFATTRANRISTAVQLALAIWFVSTSVYSSSQSWGQQQAQKSALFGIWDVDELSLDGQPRPPLATDASRWRRVLFDYPQYVMLQRFDDSSAWFGADIDSGASKIHLVRTSDKGSAGDLSFNRPTPEHMTLDGTMDGHPIHMQLTRTGPEKLQLLSRGFHWVSEVPFNR